MHQNRILVGGREWRLWVDKYAILISFKAAESAQSLNTYTWIVINVDINCRYLPPIPVIGLNYQMKEHPGY